MNCHFQRNADRTKEARVKKDEAKRVVYAMPADFCRMFDDHVDDLYTLSFLLTADHHKADQCFVAGLEDCLQGNPVFREWTQSWARRMVIKNAIRIIAPLRNETETAIGPPEPISEADTAVAAITSLQPFDRFVFVLSVLERYSDSESSILLDCTVDRVVDARVRALQRLGSVGSRNGAVEMPLTRVAKELKPLYGEAS